MNRYDEDEVVALLRDAVPPPPEAAADRVAAVKHRAGRQRATLWTQALGAVASVLLVVGVAAAVSGPDGPRRIEPVDEPLKALATALANERSVRIEATMRLVGKPERMSSAGLSAEQLAQVVDSHLTGAATRDGDLTVSGDASFVKTWGFGYDPDSRLGQDLDYEVDFEVVDGVTYSSGLVGETLPQGKTWVSRKGDDLPDIADLVRALNVVSLAAEDVDYVREYDIANEPVAEYKMVIPAKLTGSIPVEVKFALDAENRPRRVTSQFSLTDVMEGSSGYEESDSAARPPASPSPAP